MKITTKSTANGLKSETAIYGSVEDIIKLAEQATKHTVSATDLETISLKTLQQIINREAFKRAYGSKKNM